MYEPLRLGHLVFLISIFLSSCGMNSNRQLGIPNDSATGFDPFSQTTTPFDGLEDVFGEIEGETEEEVDALDAAQEAAGALSRAYLELLDKNASAQDIAKGIDGLTGARQRALAAADKLEEAGFTDLANVLRDIGLLADTYQFLQPVNGDHFLVSDPEEGKRAAHLGVVFVGLGPNVYLAPREGCALPLYRCLFKGIDRFVSLRSNCNGSTKELLLGFVCQARGTSSSQPLVQLFNPAPTKAKLQDHVTVTTPGEADRLKKQGYAIKNEFLGFPPHM